MQPILFIDRDGTLIKEPDDFQIDSFEKLEFVPRVITWLSRLVKESNYRLVMVTNQDGLGTSSFPEETFWGPQNLLIKTLAGEGVVFDDILIDKSFENENSPNRKPRLGLVQKYLDGNWDISNSWVIGDRLTDVQFAKNIGCKSAYISTEKNADADISTSSWEIIYNELRPKRIAFISRKTNETSIDVNINLDGVGKSNIDSGLGFMNHMLDQLAKHSGFDIDIKCKGDLEVDEHHTVEDIAIALGEALKIAIGDKRGINRFGFCLPMDESRALVSLDLSGRAYLVWNATFTREMIGDTPTELFKHFFHSIAYAAGITLNIEAQGENEHHKIEAIFKAFAKSLKQAAIKDGDALPTTKGLI
ncbi:MAG: bifunctional histidinol-phosphatase/imidazoleglycerol-phosphate dehydratase HisB [Bacteroidales bacterium]|nr:MAG: bifunctional histidinol-phosphatase/imidazoleglycerol-phosphate dehydratase HisB [Bacteroidales bacterium]